MNDLLGELKFAPIVRGREKVDFDEFLRRAKVFEKRNRAILLGEDEMRSRLEKKNVSLLPSGSKASIFFLRNLFGSEEFVCVRFIVREGLTWDSGFRQVKESVFDRTCTVAYRARTTNDPTPDT